MCHCLLEYVRLFEFIIPTYHLLYYENIGNDSVSWFLVRLKILYTLQKSQRYVNGKRMRDDSRL